MVYSQAYGRLLYNATKRRIRVLQNLPAGGAIYLDDIQAKQISNRSSYCITKVVLGRIPKLLLVRDVERHTAHGIHI